MINFDFEIHFKKFSQNNFYNNLSYSDLLLDTLKIRKHFFNETYPYPVALKIENPYLCFACILASLFSKNRVILLSPKEVNHSIQLIQQQLYFENILDDSILTKAPKDCDNLEIKLNYNEMDHLVFCQTSGSSGNPKSIALTFYNFYYSSLGFIEYINQSPDEISYLNLPHHHVGGLMVIWRAFISGSKVTNEFKLPIDYISLVPTQLQQIIKDEHQSKKLSSIKCILIGGAPLPEKLKLKAEELKLNIYETYGMTETCSLITLNGKVLPYRKIFINDKNYFCVGGEVLSPGAFQGNVFYPFHESLETNDLGENINEKYIFKQRKDLVFISGGENIHPQNIESVALECPAIDFACCTWVADDKWDQMNILLYQTKANESITEIELLNFLRVKLSPHQIPKFAFKTQITDNSQIKINRNNLKNLAEKLYLKKIFSHEYYPSLIEKADTIIFLHGFMGDKKDFKEIALSLNHEHNVLLVDLPGHGKTSFDHFLSKEEALLKLSKFIDLFSKNPILYGYSMGGRIALELALNYNSIKKLFLESASLGLESKEECTLRLSQDQKLSTEINSENFYHFLTSWYKNPIFYNYQSTKTYSQDIKNKLEQSTQELKQALLTFTPATFPLFYENMIKISKSNFPIFYICGEHDIKYRKFEDTIKKFQRNTIIISNAGHNPHKTHPIEILQFLIDSLKL